MARRVLVIVIGLLLVGGVALWYLQPAPAPKTAPDVPSEAPATVAEPTAVPEAPAPAPTTRAAAPERTPATPPAVTPSAAPTTGTVRIDSDVPGADVFMDRVYLGAAPATAEGVAPGAHQFKVTAPGFDSVTETIDVTPGPRDVTISLKAIRLNASLSVTHKHRFGSCQGTLTANADGLRYATDNKDDGFSTPLSGLKTIAVDYLAKTMKIELASGKSYTFTTTDGSADPLVIFQRDVDKARAKTKTTSGVGF